VNAHGNAMALAVSGEADSEFEATFTALYGRVARLLARVVRDPGRAEELAVEVFLKWQRHTEARGAGAAGWLCRTAIRMGLDELRRQARRSRYERLIGVLRRSPATPEDVRAMHDEQRRVRVVLGSMRRRDAALLLLRADGLSYEELAAGLDLNSSSVGTYISRAQCAFRAEYLRRYGTD
jgi:RNA polymerase sigma-70 factor (ECF subfamily)